MPCDRCSCRPPRYIRADAASLQSRADRASGPRRLHRRSCAKFRARKPPARAPQGMGRNAMAPSVPHGLARKAPQQPPRAARESASFCGPLEAWSASRLVCAVPEGQMPIATRLTELLKIQHPIISAPMAVVADAKLATAVSKAGGFGILGGGYGDEAWLRRELDAAGDARIGVGFITWSMAKNPRVLDLAFERKPPAIMLSFGDVAPHAEKIKRAGALLICQVQTVAHAKAALENGADVLIAQGAEAGGHGDARGTFALVPAVVDAARGVPVAAAGGVADGRGLAAALMLGADGVLVGTRFYATLEAAIHHGAKERVVAT